MGSLSSRSVLSQQCKESCLGAMWLGCPLCEESSWQLGTALHESGLHPMTVTTAPLHSRKMDPGSGVVKNQCTQKRSRFAFSVHFLLVIRFKLADLSIRFGSKVRVSWTEASFHLVRVWRCLCEHVDWRSGCAVCRERNSFKASQTKSCPYKTIDLQFKSNSVNFQIANLVFLLTLGVNYWPTK